MIAPFAPGHVPTYEASPVTGNRTMFACGRRIVCPTCEGKRIVQKPFPQGCSECRGIATVVKLDSLATVTQLHTKKVNT